MLIDEMIIRLVRGEATISERRQIELWRRESVEAEQRYKAIVAIINHALDKQIWPNTRIPSAGSIIEKATSRDRSDDRIQISSTWVTWPSVATATAAAVILLVSTVLFGSLETVFPPWSSDIVEYRTGPAEQRTLKLADGTLVHLGPETRLEVLRSDPEPELRLDGRAFFGVPHINGRRVLIRTAAGTVTVLGTRFDVRSSGEDLQLLVVDGKVAVSAGDQHLEIDSGKLSLVNSGFLETIVRIEEPLEYLAWMGSTMIFQNTRLDHVVNEIASRYGAEIELLDTALASRTVTTAFEDQSFQQVMTVVCGVVQARCTFDNLSVSMHAL